jgi:ATP-binding cassette subfamily B protein/subfamily B ATP-binding cassette protein MsbA
MNLLLRFIPVDRGSILLDGQDISTLQIQQLRRQIGFVPQRAFLMNGTIRANIAYGLDHASDEQVERAAHLSQALEFILALPDGFDTQIGDRGVRLSGGQRQRISLARALILDPPILLLDEATSMYDVEGEQAFVAACTSALSGRTVIFTTHRPASLAIADRIICVANGTVSEVTRTPAGSAGAWA